MLRWAILFLVIALVAALLGFGGVAGMSYAAARLVFFVFLVLFVVALVMGRRMPGDITQQEPLMVAQRIETEPSFAELVGDMAGGMRELAAAHAAQLQEELTTEANRAQRAVGLLAGGGILAGVGTSFVLVSMVDLLIDQAGWSRSAAWLLVGSVSAVIGALLIAGGYQIWRRCNPIPRQTLNAIQESLKWISRR